MIYLGEIKNLPSQVFLWAPLSTKDLTISTEQIKGEINGKAPGYNSASMYKPS